MKKPRLHNLPERKEFRRELRNRLTPAEATLWKRLQRSKLQGRKFRRQHSVGIYILDFFCVEERLAVELDGEDHFSLHQAAYDRERQRFLNKQGIKVLRFENAQVFQEIEYVLYEIQENFGWWKQIDILIPDSPPG